MGKDSELQTKLLLDKWKPLLAGYSGILLTLATINGLLGILPPLVNVAILLASLCLWTWGIVYIENRPPRKRNNDKFGLGIFIATENEKMRSRLDNDFLARLNETIRNHDLYSFFEIVVASPIQAAKYVPFLDQQRDIANEYKGRNPGDEIPEGLPEGFNKFQQRTGCRFFVWGTLTERKHADLDGGTGYVFKTDTIVAHSPLLPEGQKLLNEAVVRWLREVKIDERAEYEGLRVTADEMFILADLIIGTAATLVGKPWAGLALHEPLLEPLEKLKGDKHHAAVYKHLVRMVTGENEVLGGIQLTDGDPELARKHISNALALNPKSYGAHLLLARLQYEHDNDPAAALETTNRAKPFSRGRPIWRYNIAFLQMAAGKYKDGWKTYNEIFRDRFEGEDAVVASVVAFNLKQFMNKGLIISLFVAGLVTFRKTPNLPAALDYMERFVTEAATQAELLWIRQKAIDVLKEIRIEMGLEDETADLTVS
jgi:tetratricopeptide (TPR) repeat protein